MSKRKADGYESYESSGDEADVDSLMHLLDDVGSSPDLSLQSSRSNLSKTILLKNFGLNENGPVNYRDATVLGKHTRVQLPSTMLDADKIRLSIFLDHPVALSDATRVQHPMFNDKTLRARDFEIGREHPLEKHERWVVPSTLLDRDDLSDGEIEFKKSKWALSRGFRNVSGQRWPKFVLVATAYRSGSPCESSISQSFEVRSKEQSNKSRASRGLSESIRRRRTPETEARAEKLRKIQGQIMAIRDEIARERKKHVEYQTTLNFVRAITQNCPHAGHIHSIVR